jgi:hypothetical protein
LKRSQKNYSSKKPPRIKNQLKETSKNSFFDRPNSAKIDFGRFQSKFLEAAGDLLAKGRLLCIFKRKQY